MPLKSDINIDAVKFSPDSASEQARKVSQFLGKMLNQGPKWHEVGAARFREMYERGETALPPPAYHPDALNVTIPSRNPGRNIACRLVYPAARKGAEERRNTRGTILHIHGGGWVLGDQKYSDDHLMFYADAADCAVLSVGYRLAPEHPFPQGPEDCYDVGEYLVNNGEKEYGGPLRFIGDESAGGHLSLLTAFHLLKTQPAFKPSGLLLHYGCFDMRFLPSMRTSSKTVVIDQTIMERYVEALLPNMPVEQRSDPSISPLFEDLEKLRGRLPSAIFTCGTDDPLLDDSVMMGTKWLVAGGEAIIKVYPEFGYCEATTSTDLDRYITGLSPRLSQQFKQPSKMDSGVSAPGSTVDTQVLGNAIALPLFAAVGILITIVPLRSLYRVKNIAACTLIITAMVLNIMTFVNALIWPTDNFDTWWKGVGLCDVEVAVRTPLFTLVTSSTMCITRLLARALDTDNAMLHETKAMRLRTLMIECLLVFTIPVLEVALHYLIQAQRFEVATIYGCADILDYSWPTLVIMHIWPPIFAIATCFYASKFLAPIIIPPLTESVLVMYRLRKHRDALAGTLSSTGSGLSPRRFLKLFMLSLLLLLIFLPVTLYYLYLNLPPYWPAYNFSAIHDPNFWPLIIFSKIADLPALQYDGWLPIVLAFLIFFFFGLNREAVQMYKTWLVKLGFGNCFPSLLVIEEEGIHRHNATNSRGSWTSNFDLVSKAMHYFNGSRKNSLATTLDGPGSETTQSRKGSHATFDPRTISSILTNSTDTDITHDKALNLTITPHPSSNVPDLITPAPLPSPPLPTTPFLRPLLPTFSPSPPPLTQKPLFSLFRTHLNFPFPLVSQITPVSNHSTKNTGTQTSFHLPTFTQPFPHHDLESQIHSRNDHCSSASTTDIFSTHSVYPEAEGISGLRMGTRAFREREQRERDHELRRGNGGERGASKGVEDRNGSGGSGSVVVEKSFSVERDGEVEKGREGVNLE
ncbi:hypothetical protein B7494_g1076 [Chlorociboria aeruginascens]|nr:hypothetical protein B7494_g1076 [Chlorociboria aeruginascens]